MNPPLPEFNETAVEKISAEKIAMSQARPFTVSIMGQTGVGKTSLLKALFNKVLYKNGDLLVGHVRPTTRNPVTHTIKGENGLTLVINDLPGIGESNSADQIHLDTYQKYFRPSDLVLWAIQADSRSTTVDAHALDHLLEKLSTQDQERLMSKIVFVLTKVDTLLPSPWTMRYNNPSVYFSPGPERQNIIKDKQEFFQEQLIQPFGSHIISRTHNDVSFALDGPSFWYDDNEVTYRGLLTKEHVEKLSKTYPGYKDVFMRLYDNYCPVPCSARFKYNLPQLMLVILNKLGFGSDAVQSFERIVDIDLLNNLSLGEALQLCNLLIWNIPDNRKIFDLEEGIFPDPKNDSAFYKEKTKQKRNGLLGEPHFFARLFAIRA